jgi:hypothetical protein
LLRSLHNLYCWTLCHYIWTGQSSSLPSMDAHETPTKKKKHFCSQYSYHMTMSKTDILWLHTMYCAYIHIQLEYKIIKNNKLTGVTRCDQMECTYFSVLPLCHFTYLSDLDNYKTNILHWVSIFYVFNWIYTIQKKNFSNKSYRPYWVILFKLWTHFFIENLICKI